MYISKASLLLVLCLCSLAYAQDNEFEIQSDDSYQADLVLPDYPDKAVIVIRSWIPNLKFKSTLGIIEHKSVPEEGKYILVIEPQKQVITVIGNKYKTDYTIKKPKPRDQVFLKIVEKQRPLNTELGTFSLNTIPEGANFEIDGLPISGITPFQLNEIKAETYKIRISKEEYESKEIIVSINKNKPNPTVVRLTPKFGYITVNTRHTDATLYINNSVWRDFQSGKPIKIGVGQLSIELKKHFYHDFITTVRVDPNDNSTESIPIHVELIRQKGRLVVKTNPTNAKVYLDAQYLGDTADNTALNRTVDAGKYILEVRKVGYRTEQITVEVLNSQTISESITLYPNAIIHIEGTQGASVYIDDDDYEGERIPIKSKIIEQGQHRIRVEKEGYDTQISTFTVKAEEKTLTYNLIKTKWRAFRWTGRGNERISSILTSLSLSAGYFILPGTSQNLLYSPIPGVGSPVETETNNIQGLATDVSVFFPPLTFTFGLGLPVPGSGLAETRGLLYYGNANWTPFVLYEVLYPSIGINYTSGGIEYLSVVNETIAKLKYASWGRHYELRISSYNKKGDGFFGGFFLKFGYSDYFDNKSGLEKLLYINGGVWWGSQRH